MWSHVMLISWLLWLLNTSACEQFIAEGMGVSVDISLRDGVLWRGVVDWGMVVDVIERVGDAGSKVRISSIGRL